MSHPDPLSPVLPQDVTPAPPRKRRRWLKVLGVLVVLLLLLVLLLPTLLSTGPARSLILGQIAPYVPQGKLTIDDWSLGWFSPIQVHGLKLFDQHGDLMVQADTLKTDLTLTKAIRQQFALGETFVDADAVHVVVYADGSSNVQRAFEDPKAPKAAHNERAPSQSATPAKLPNVSGNITLKLKGRVEMLDVSGKPITTLALHEGTGGTLKIDDINNGVAPDLKLIYDLGDAKRASEIAISGTIDAVNNNEVNLAQLAAKLNIAATTVDLAALQPFLAMAGQPELRIGGIAGGAIAGELKPGQAGEISGAFDVDDFRIATPQIKEEYHAKTVHIPVKAARVASADGSRLNVDASVILPESSLQLVGDLPESALAALGQRAIPGEAGTVTISLHADPKKLAAALPKTTQIKPGMTIDGGALLAVSSIQIDPAAKALLSHTTADFSLQGKQDGRPQTIPPISVIADAKLTQLDNIVAGLRDMRASMTSGFANLKIEGADATSINGGGDADLGKLLAQAAQFVNIGDMKLAGAANFTLQSKLDTAANVTHAQIVTDLKQLNVQLGQKPALALAATQLKVMADVQSDGAPTNLTAIRSADVSLTSGDSADKPLLDFAARVTGYDLSRKTVQSIDVSKCTMASLRDVQARLIDPFNATLKDQHITFADGALYLVAKVGPSDLNTNSIDLTQCDVSLPNLRIERDGKELLRDTVRVSAVGKTTGGETMTVNLSKLSLQSALAKITGTDVTARLPKAGESPLGLVKNAKLTVGMPDVAKVQALANAFAPASASASSFGGGVALNVNIDNGKVTTDFEASRMSVTNGKGESFAFSKSKPVAAKASFDLPGALPVNDIKITQLDADFDVAHLTSTGPIVVSNLTKKAAADGGFKLTASLDRVAALLQVIQSSPQPLPYRGNVNLVETLSTSGKVISLKGDGGIDQFSMVDAEGKTQFTEPKLKLVNDISIDQTAEIATLKTFGVDMTSSNAAKLNVTGGVKQWTTRRELDNIVLKLDADGAKAWPVVYAMLSPAQQVQFKDAVVKGPITASFNLGGAYPTAATWNESFKSLAGKGAMAVESINTMGLNIEGFALPLTIRNGQVITGDATAKGAARQVKPFAVNGGSADFSNIVLNLSDPNLLLSIGKGQKLLQKVQINSVMAAQLGSLASVVFKDSKEASGELDLTSMQCENVRLADLMNKQATATFLYSIHQLKLDGPVPSTLAQLLDLGGQGFVGEIDKASLALKSGMAYQDMTVGVLKEVEQTNAKTGEKQTVPTTETLQFKGGVNLTSNKFDDYALKISSGLLLRDWRKSFPDGADVKLTGRVDDVTGILAQAVGSLAVQGYGGNALDQLLGGGKKKKDE